jgi:hypothetical protein
MLESRFNGELLDGELHFEPYSKFFILRALQRVTDAYDRFTVEHSHGLNPSTSSPIQHESSSQRQAIAEGVIQERREILWRQISHQEISQN